MIHRALPFAIIFFGFGLAYLLIATGPKLSPQATTRLAPVVRVVTANSRQVKLSTFTNGTIAPRTESDIVPEVSGRIKEIAPSMVSGGFFKKDDVLITIEPLDYELALTQTKAGLARAISDLRNAKKSYQRQIGLAKTQSSSQSQQDDASNRLRIAEATADEARAKLARAKRDLKRTKIRAPYDGRVRNERVDVGQFINRGNTVATIYAIDYVEVRLPVHDEELAYLDLSLGYDENQNAKPLAVTLRARFAGLDHEWQGQVVRTEGELDPQTHMLNIVAMVPLPYSQENRKAPLSVGLFVEAEIHGSIANNIVVLPRTALRNTNQVFVIDAGNKLRIRSVEVLRIFKGQVYIKSGLENGEQVCISQLNSILDGMSVRIQEDK